MNIGKKIWKIAIAALLIAPLFAGSLNASAATEGNVDVTVHKRVFDDNMPEYKENTGLEMPDFGGRALNGAGFTVYDVTAQYHAALVGKTQAEAMATVIAEYNDDDTGFTKVGNEQFTADPDGTTKFANLPLYSNDLDAAYLFVETTTPTDPNIIQKAAPFILAMPIYTAMDSTGVLNTDIHVYPKNVTAEDTKVLENAGDFGTITLETGGQSYPNVQIGDILNYKLTINVPVDIADLTSFKVKDTPGAGMALAPTPNIVVAGLTVGAGNEYTISTAGNILELTFDTAKLAAAGLAGQTLTITYDMVLTVEAIPDTPIKNSATTIQIDGENETEIGITPPPGVVTGGKQFIKHDKHTAKALAGAKFKVTNGTQWAKFIVNTKGEYAFNGWGTEAQATEVVAGTDGVFKVIGLTAGNYELKETVAPNGYVLLADNVSFTVVANGYGSTDTLRQTVNNVPKGLLPSTGGTGIYAFLIIGSMMMAGAYFWFKRSKEHAEV